MNLSQVKLVVTDMDGTLLNSNHEVSSRFFELFKKMKTHDILFVAASGRPYYGIVTKFDTIKDDMIIVAENGGLVVKNGNTLLSNPIKKDNLSEITGLVASLSNVHPVFCTKQKAYVMSKSKPLLDLLSEYYACYELIETPEYIDEDIYKIALFHEENSEKHIYPHVKHLESNFKIKISANHWVDISENIANKGHAVNLIQNMYNIKEEETMVFGDYNNDLEMLETAYFSYAMQNAHPKVKSVARFETKSNNDFGVEHILHKLLLDKEKLVTE
ncbi:HAD family hydrolase [Snuella lapsa]|uniref:HAD family hydrolase n=1 Tax=Snuella lapsa TaxID=870481 RepID=A0ABP6YB13_9FLAO